MTDLLKRLSSNQQKGSKPRCHWMTHGLHEQVAHRLTKLIEPWGHVSSTDRWMPEGFANTAEAELHSAPRLLNSTISKQLQNWWLVSVISKSRTPNWDIASTCTVTIEGEHKSGLLLVEAKAHDEELNKEEVGKKWDEGIASEGSKKNHIQIGEAICSACDGLHNTTSLEWKISRDRNYQMSNRFAWSWKLTELGIPVILVYLGFLNAEEMRKGNTQKPFANHVEWESLVKSHSKALFPETVWGKSRTLYGQPFIPLIRSMDIPYDKPPTEAQV